ncbi:Phosphopantetheine binding ACP domain-containing protein [Hirschfeldia incana]|nr:Phosphopantetheine binding ACP domain-containing protein [Hirschfeldia incana]
MASRNALLRYLRINVAPTLRSSSITSHRGVAAPLFAIIHRRFSEEVRGSFLDKSEVTDRVVSVVKTFQKVEPSKVTPKAHFQNDLGLDSLDTVEVVMALEEEFGFEIPDNEADKIQSVDLAVEFIASHPQAK